MHIKTQKTATAGLLASLAILLGYVEFLIPVVPPIAGIKLGLGNIAVLAALLLMQSKGMAACIMLTKVLLTSLLFSGVGGLAYALAGGIVSLLVMIIAARCPQLSAAGVSCAGGAAHMAAQVAVAVGFTSTPEVLLLLPLLMAVGVVTGFLNGILLNFASRSLKSFLAQEKPIS